MIEQLFGSKTRVKLLQLFFTNPNRSFYVREITRKIDEQINSVRRELANLLSIGIISSEDNNNRLYYEVNQQSEHYDALRAMFGGVKAKGSVSSAAKATPKIASEEETEIKKVGNIDIAILTGQFTRDESSGIDMLVVGNVNDTKLQKYIADLEKKEGKEVRFVLMDIGEFNYRKQVKDRFLTNVLSAKKQILVDKKNHLES